MANRRRRTRPALRITSLEDRVTPAFTVDDTATVLTFTGDDAGNTLVVIATAADVRYSANGGPEVVLTNARPDTLERVVVTVGSGNDRIDLSGLGVTLTAMARAGGGADVTGGAGNDTLIGTQLDDTLDGGAGSDSLDGQGGDDTLKARDFEPDTLTGGAGHDGAYFESTDVVTTVEANNPFTPTADNQVHKVKVLVLNFDPLVPSQNNQHLYELFPWWNPPQKLAEGYKAALERASGGYLQFEITDWRNINEIPVFTDGFQYTPDQYYQNRQTNTGWHTESSADVPRIIREQNVVPLVDAGLVDEVWFFGDHFFAIGGESFMMGSGSFFINGPTYPQVPSSRPFVGYGFSYERGVAEMLHNTAHRAENHGNRTYGGWNLASPQNNWDKFSANVTQSNGVAGVGTGHYPANATGDYDYGNATVVSSWADDYLDYPTLSFTPRPVNRESWSHGDPDYHRTYLEWYFGHFPRAAGTGPDGKPNNWFKFNWDFDNYQPGGAPKPFRAAAQVADLFNLGGSEYLFRVAYSSPVPVDVATIDSTDVRVTGPNGFNQLAELVSVSDPSNGTHRVATYRVTAPGGGWDAADGGAYIIHVEAGQVFDTTGAPLAAGSVGRFLVRTTDPAETPSEPDTSLLVHFTDSLNGQDGETPAASNAVTFGPGVAGPGVLLGTDSWVRYSTAGNIDSLSGTLEFWIRPGWAGTDPTTRYLVSAGSFTNNGMLLYYYAPSHLLAFQMWGDDQATPAVEVNVGRGYGVDISGWQAGQWHHVAATWDAAAGHMALYLDGTQQWAIGDAVRVPAFSTATFQFGSAGGTADELRVSAGAFDPARVAQSYRTAGSLSDLTAATPTPALTVGDRGQVLATVTRTPGGLENLTDRVRWTSSVPEVAAVDDAGTLRALAAGSTTITAQLGDLTATVPVTVTDTNRPTATLTPVPDITTAGGTELLLTIEYDDDTGLNAATCDGRDVWVHSANGFSQYARFVSATPAGNGRPRTATYRITPPGAAWDARDNGTYVVEVMDWQVGDATGQYVAAAELGRFAVALLSQPPTDITLSNDQVAENQPADTEVGTLTATDDTPGETFTFTLVDDAGGRFQVAGDRLRTTTALDYEAGATHVIRVRVTDAAGNPFEKDFTIRVGNVNEAPTDVGLFPETVSENVAVGTVVGDLVVTDPDAGDTYTLALVPGTGADDNAAFALVNGRLVTGIPLDYEVKNTYTVRVRATDAGGLAVERALTVTVSDEDPERPTIDTRPMIVLPAVVRNAKDPAGTPVVALVVNADDDDAPAAVGVAVTGAGGKGTWQYSPDGTTWSAVGVVTPSAALLLDRPWQVRFVPARGFHGFAELTYQAWDGQTGSAGGRVSVADTPITFSADREKAWVAVGRTVPKIDAAGQPLLKPVREDARGGKGNPVRTILGLLARELGIVTPLGIAVTAVSTTAGTWQYSVTGGRKWADVGAVGDGSALLLRPQDRLRFRPDPNFDGEATVTYRTWSLAGTAGTKVPATASGFSSATETAVADVVPVNDRPVLDLSWPAVVGPVAAGGATAAAPFDVLMSATDVDGDPVGVAVVRATGPGTWHYRPAGWADTVLPPVSNGKALLLGADTEVWFEAAADASAGTAALSFRAWDGSNGKPAESRAAATGTAFSKEVEVLTAAVANTRPLLDLLPEPTLTDVIVGKSPGRGDRVRDLLGTAVTDPDAAGVAGIAVTLADTARGVWWYSLGGNRWEPVAPVNAGAALLLPDTARLRFVPDAGFTGTATLEYRAWDRSAGMAGDRIDTTGGLDSFSTEIETAAVTVRPA